MSASIEILSRFGFPKGILEALKADGVTELLEPQVEAVLRCNLLGEDDLLVSLPTSCGKTLIGELAGVGAALLGKRAVFSVPLKALAREKFELFRRRYAKYGLRIRLATGEYSEHLSDLERGDYDIAVLIHEKLKHLALREPTFLRGIGVAVVDELQGVEDQARGPDLEILLALLKRGVPRVRRIGLLGVIAPDDPLIDDFGGRILTARRRPIDLRQGIVLADGELARTALEEYGVQRPPSVANTWVSIYRSHNTGLVEAEALPISDPEGGVEGDLLRLAVGLSNEDGSVLLFLPTRREAEQAARLLAEAAPFLGSVGQLPEGAEEMEDESLHFCLTEGVAFHHSDCSPRSRALVEEAFRSGAVRILCCTSTLAMGVNLPARTVLIHPFVWNRSGQTGDLSLLPAALVRNMAGRAGRLGLGEEHGRALLVARTQREWDLYRRFYWTDLAPRLRPTLLAGDLGPHLLAGAALGQDTSKKLLDLLAGLLSSKAIPLPHLEQRLAEGIERARSLGLLEALPTPDAEGERFELSPLGRIVALRGLSFETARTFAEWVQRFEGNVPSDLLALLVIAGAEETQEWSWPREIQPEARARWVEQARERLGWESLHSLGGRWTEEGSVSRRAEDAAKLASALQAWASGEPVPRLRERLGFSPGSLHAVGEGARWLLETLADIWRARGRSAEGCAALRGLARRVGCGLPEEALAWDLIPSDLLERDRKILLARELHHPRDLLSANPADFPRILSASRFGRVRAFVREILSRGNGRKSQRSSGQPPNPPSNSAQAPTSSPSRLPKNGEAARGSRPTLLCVDFETRGAYFLARTWKQEALMGMRGAELLLRLVRGRFNGDSEGWVPKKALGVDPEHLSQRISDLRARLGPPPPGHSAWIESDRAGHYRLAIPSESLIWTAEATPEPLQALLR